MPLRSALGPAPKHDRWAVAPFGVKERLMVKKDVKRWSQHVY
jgi:hypothetical protein